MDLHTQNQVEIALNAQIRENLIPAVVIAQIYRRLIWKLESEIFQYVHLNILMKARRETTDGKTQIY